MAARATSGILAALRGPAEHGVAILMISSDKTKIGRVSDRVVLMHDSHIVGEFSGEATEPHALMQLATGERRGHSRARAAIGQAQR